MSLGGSGRGWHRFLAVAGLALLAWAPPALAQLTQAWTVTVNGQSVPVNPDGTFEVSDISADDRFGADGPGSFPDGLSDDFLRLVGISTEGDLTRYVYSEPFQIRQGQTFVVGGLTFTEAPPPVPRSIRLTVEDRTLTRIGQATRVRAEATLADGRTLDVTPRGAWTSYGTSNPEIATIDQDGRVTATGTGLAFLTATNGGATAVARLDVVPGDPLTTVGGTVVLADGTPAGGARVEVVGLGRSAQSSADGSFAIPDIPTTLGTLGVAARAVVQGRLLTGRVAGLAPVPGGLTDAGLVTLDGGGRVLIVSTDTSSPVAKLRATGLFETVDFHQLSTALPTLAQLAGYDSVLAYTRFIPPNAVALGNVLADYVDAGGHLAIATYSFSTPWAIRGRITQPGYSPLCDSGINRDVTGRLVPLVLGDLIFTGVDLDALRYFHNFNFASPTLDPGATLLATDGAGVNMIARSADGRIVALNLFPSVFDVANNDEFFELVANSLLR
ncbi:MAG TPA: hypothetical protein VE685_27135 [Thermoanaerobaculia bacterium]|nr:hypothetical protein [Thermoanaerobaculia bacterium]